MTDNRPPDAGEPKDKPARPTTPGSTRPTKPASPVYVFGAKPTSSVWKQRLRTGFKYSILAGLAAFVLGVVTLAVAYAQVDVPKPGGLHEETVLYWSGDKKDVLATLGENRTIVTLDAVPIHVQNAVLAAEDHTFYSNRGVSPRGIARAVKNNVLGGDLQGGSTITQQYVKNTYDSVGSERTLKRKAKEFLMALKVDEQVSKTQLLEDYLNTIYWGRGAAFGVESAAQSYFGKPASKLTVSEGAYLAGIIRGPGLYDPDTKREAAEDRWNRVLDAMVNYGYLTPEERAKQKYPAKSFVKAKSGKGDLSGPRGHLVKAAVNELLAKGLTEKEIYTGGLQVTTTFDKKMQAAAETAVRKEFPKSKKTGVKAGLVSIYPPTGEVRAMYGGENATLLNQATQAKKQAGSTFKAFTLVAALSEGYSLRERRWQGDAPYRPKDEDGKPVLNKDGKEVTVGNTGDGQGRNYGTVSLLEATQKSINTAFVDVTQTLGAEEVRDALESAGLHRSKVLGLNAVPTVTLGSAAVSPADMASAYATLASGGKRTSWHVVRSAVRIDQNGEEIPVVARDDGRPEQVFDEQVVADATYALTQVVADGTGTVAKGLRRPAAAKTGTHESAVGNVSAWFAGYTPELATAVNYYREDKDGAEVSLNGVGGAGKFYGGGFPGRTWTTFMESALQGEAVKSFPPPSEEALPPQPTVAPTTGPTDQPTQTPTDQPTTATPTAEPTTTEPTQEPTKVPTTPTPTTPGTPTLTPRDPPTATVVMPSKPTRGPPTRGPRPEDG